MGGVVEGGAQPQVVLDDGQLQGVVRRHAEHTEACRRQQGGGAERLQEGLGFLRLHGQTEGDGATPISSAAQQGGGGGGGVQLGVESLHIKGSENVGEGQESE